MAELAIIIPAYNRVDLLEAVLKNTLRAVESLDTELFIIDDGSHPPLSESIQLELPGNVHLIRQENQGLVYAKYSGLMAITSSEYVLFLDSDDFFAADKIKNQLEVLKESGGDICYTDTAKVKFDPRTHKISAPFSTHVSPDVETAAELYLKAQPAPHSPIFKYSYLISALRMPLIPLHPIFNPIGEVWFYYNLLLAPAKIIKMHSACTWTTVHEEDRITRHWERLGVASMTLMTLFMKNTRQRDDAGLIRQMVGEAAFSAYRKLPRNFHPDFEKQLLQIYDEASLGPESPAGGPKFQCVSKLLGEVLTARLFKYFQRPHYNKLRTISVEELESLMKLSSQAIDELSLNPA